MSTDREESKKEIDGIVSEEGREDTKTPPDNEVLEESSEDPDSSSKPPENKEKVEGQTGDDSPKGEDGKAENEGDEKNDEAEKEKEAQRLKLSRPATVVVQRAGDEMRAMVQIMPPVGEGSHITVEQINKVLAEKKISFGIDEEKIKEIVEQQSYGQTHTIAKGRPPDNGMDAQLIYHFDKLLKRQDLSLENLDQVDWKELGKIINTEPKVLLLEKEPPTEGEPGLTVTNKKVRQTKGKDLRIRVGKGARADEDGLKWYSTIAGHVIFRNNQIMVDNIIEVEDVNAETGNVHFNGSVVIKGIVEDGFSVDCTGDLRIQGNVGAAKLTAKGDITIAGGVFGKKHAVITATEGSICMRFSQDAVMVAGTDIVVDEYVRNSELKAARAIRVVNDNPVRGCIMGGTASALAEIQCNNVGSEMELYTRVVIGITKEDMDRVSTLENSLKKSLDNLDNLRKNLFMLQREKRRQGELDARRKEFHERFLGTLSKMRVATHRHVIDLVRIYHSYYGKKKSYLHVKNNLHANVEVTIKHANTQIKKPLQYATLVETDGSIEVLPLMEKDDGAEKTDQG